MGFTPDFLDEIRNRVPISDVVGRKVKLIRKGRENSGLCPFHNEKTPSFTVNDDKAFYHCFGCGAHGDVIRFMTETEGLSFPETVERLAGMAGLQMPEYSPEQQARSAIKKNLYDVMEVAAKWFESQLQSQAGKVGLDYLLRRGLSRQTLSRFRLGFAPDGRTALKEALLAREGITEEMLIEGGLLIKPEDRPDSYDRFRGRVMFPITDRQGRVVAFGGRALDKNAKAKYLNSPETPLFHKGRLLYNLSGARKAAFDQGQVLVAEGYMDVIALSQAGFENAVAPLGTAVTEDQIRELWRLAPEPLMCFDGDKAGYRAAERVVDRALPLLKAGHSLRFVHLPEGEDPDSYVGGHGADAFRDLLASGQPLAHFLWRMNTHGVAIETPEQRAGLEKKLAQTLGEISNENIRTYYEKDFQKRLNGLFGEEFSSSHGLEERIARENHPSPAPRRNDKKTAYTPSVTHQGVKNLKETSVFKGGKNISLKREKLLILTVLNHPWMLKKHHEEFATYDFESEELDKLRREIIGISVRESNLERESLNHHLKKNGFGRAIEVIFKQGELKAEWFAWPGTAPEDVEQGWRHVINRRRRVSDIEKDLDEAQKLLVENMTEEVYARFLALSEELENANGNEASIEGYGVASGRGKSS